MTDTPAINIGPITFTVTQAELMAMPRNVAADLMRAYADLFTLLEQIEVIETRGKYAWSVVRWPRGPWRGDERQRESMSENESVVERVAQP